MLWLMHRLARGDVMYRDAYNVTTPVAAWLGALSVRVTGTQLAVLRALVAVSFTLQVLLGLSVVRRCGLAVPGCVVFAGALLAIGSPLVAFTNLYTSLATLGALAALRAIIWWDDRRAAHASTAAPLVAIGAACSFAFWSKPNVGLLTTGAVVVALVVRTAQDRRRTLPELATMGVGALGVSVVVAVPIAATGAWSAFVDQVFLSKLQYLDIGYSYPSAIRDRVDKVLHGTQTDLRSVLRLAIMATPVIVAVVVARAWSRNRRSVGGRGFALVAFACAGLASVFPRPGVNHFVATMPLTLAATVGMWTVARRERTVRTCSRAASAAAALAVAIGVSVVSVDSVLAYANTRATHDFERFEITPIRRGLEARMARLRAGIEANTDGRVFIARDDAGFLYFATGARDPLPYDMVQRADLGSGGERAVISRLERGDARFVCLHPPRPPRDDASPLLPRTLERWVRNHYTLVASFPACDLYREVSGSNTSPRASLDGTDPLGEAI